jgi:hypothetical protein
MIRRMEARISSIEGSWLRWSAKVFWEALDAAFIAQNSSWRSD